MAHLAFPDEYKSFTIPSSSPSIIYNYIHRRASPGSNKPTYLFLHGFPSSSYDWRRQIAHLHAQGCGVLAPDLLGYGASTSPAAPAAYRLKTMAADLMALLDREGVDKVIGVAHDLGCFLLSRCVNYHPERIAGAAFLDVGYVAPGDKFDVEMINRVTKEMTGQEGFGYWEWFLEYGAAKTMDAKPESMLYLLFAGDPKVEALLSPIDSARRWVEQGQTSELGPWLSAEEFDMNVRIYAESGYSGTLNWYKHIAANLSYEDETNLPKEIPCPTLLITAANDLVTLPVIQEQITRPYAPDLRIENLDSGHWVQLEKSSEVNDILSEFGKRCVAT